MEHIDEYVNKARLLAQALAESLPTRIEAAALPLTSKLPFKALSLRELLFHRASALASPAVSLYEAGNAISAVVLTRSLMETTAMMCELDRQLDLFLSTKDVSRFDTYLMKGLFANRYPDEEMAAYRASNILTSIQNLDKKAKGFLSAYETLSEYAHPNWSGVMGSFGSIDHGNYTIDFGRRASGKAHEVGLMTLATTLDILVTYYNEMPESLEALNKHFEPNWRQG